MAADLAHLRKWCEVDSDLPSLEVSNRLLAELIGWHLNPIVVRHLFTKASPIQLVTQGNILGPKHHAVALFKSRLQELQKTSGDSEISPETKSEYLSSPEHWRTSVDFSEACKCEKVAELQPGSLNWAALPLALCGWGALLAASTLLNWG